MRSLWTKKKYLKSTARLLNKNCVNKRGLDLFKDILWVSVGQRTAELPAVKVGGKKIFALFEPDMPAHSREVGFFFKPPNLMGGIYSTSLERSKPTLLRLASFQESRGNYFISVYSVRVPFSPCMAVCRQSKSIWLWFNGSW